MARIMIAWELGEAFGHLARCLRLARGLVARGHWVTLVLKDIRLPPGQTMGTRVTVLPAPLTPQAGAGGGSPVNYADVLRFSGFADVPDVVARLRAWQGLFSLARPDVLVADYAPTALLAARLADMSHLSIGNGFTIPPAISPWPSIRPWEVVPDQVLKTAETLLDQVLDAAQKVLGYTAAVRGRDLFGGQDILDTFAELDHYGSRPDGRYVGPIVSVPQALRVKWQNNEGLRVLTYLRPAVPGFEAILQALARLDAEVLCVAPGMSPDAAKHCATRRLRIALVPVNLPLLLKDADVSISYGNSGFSTQSLLAGVPLVMRPRYVEQALFSSRVEALGGGKLIKGRINTESIIISLREVLEGKTHRLAARKFSEKYNLFSSEAVLDRCLSLIEKCILV